MSLSQCTEEIVFLHTAGPRKGGGQGHAQGLESGNTENGHARGPESEKGNRLAPTLVSDVHEREKRSGRRKAFLPFAPDFSAV